MREFTITDSQKWANFLIDLEQANEYFAKLSDDELFAVISNQLHQIVEHLLKFKKLDLNNVISQLGDLMIMLDNVYQSINFIHIIKASAESLNNDNLQFLLKTSLLLIASLKLLTRSQNSDVCGFYYKTFIMPF